MPLQTLYCDHCGKPVQRYSQRGKHVFCSRECWTAYRVGKDLLAGRRREARTCPTCGKEFEVGGRAGRREVIFCSRSCAMNARRITGYNHCAELSPTDAAYFAGFFDGEGCVILIARPGGGFSLRIQFAQTLKASHVLGWMRDTAGVGANITHKPQDSMRHDIGTNWAIHSDAAEELLRQMLPYLRVKKAQAELAIAFQERRREDGNGDKSWQRVVADQLHFLNRRGPKAADEQVI